MWMNEKVGEQDWWSFPVVRWRTIEGVESVDYGRKMGGFCCGFDLRKMYVLDG